MSEVTNNAAVSGECKLVPVTQLKKWHRDLDACQKVIWLQGGFDPAYCMDAQDCLKEMDTVLMAPELPTNFIACKVDESCVGAIPAPDEDIGELLMMADMADNSEDHEDHAMYMRWVIRMRKDESAITRLQAEVAARDQRIAELEAALGSAAIIVRRHVTSNWSADVRDQVDAALSKGEPK
jgi:hypothetical protein